MELHLLSSDTNVCFMEPFIDTGVTTLLYSKQNKYVCKSQNPTILYNTELTILDSDQRYITTRKECETYLPPKTREAPPGPLGPSVVACVSAPKTMNKFHFMRNEDGKLKQEY
jgi:hypothetical protein